MKKSWWQAGVSLPEVMIGGALLAGLGLVGAEMFKQQNNATKYAAVRSELDAFHNNVVKLVSDYRHCNANLFGAFGATTVTSASLPANSLVQCCPSAGCAVTGTQCTPGFTFGGNTTAILTKNGSLGPGTLASGFTPTDIQLHDSTGALSVTSAGSNIIKKAEIRITYTMKGQLLGPPTIIKTIPIQLKFTTTGAFSTCVDAELNTKNTLQQELCKGLDQNLVQYNPITDKCERKITTPTHSCPTGEVLLGLDSNGNKICRSADATFIQSQAINPADATTCGGNPNVKFTWDSATNTIKVECP